MPFVITHWINLVAMVLLIFTGFYIHYPFFLGFESMARGLHVFFGFVLFINCICRLIMAFIVKSSPTGGTRKQVTDYKTWLPQKDNLHQGPQWIKYYLFFKKDHPLSAKLGVPQKKFIGYLLEKGYVFRDRHRSDRVFVRAGKRNDPLFVTRDFYLPNGAKSEYTLVTPAGKAHFLKIAEKIRVWEPREVAEGKDASEQAVFAACV